MTLKFWLVSILLWFGFSAASTAAPVTSVSPASETFTHGRFENVRVFLPADAITQVALYLPDSGGWQANDTRNVETLTAHGAMLIAIDSGRFFKELNNDTDECEFPDGDLENLSHFLQAYYKLHDYKLPYLIGTGNSASFAFATLSQAPGNTFAGLLTVDFCPQMGLSKPVCEGEGFRQIRHTTTASGTSNGNPEIQANSTLTAAWLAIRTTTASECTRASVQRFQTLTLKTSDSGLPTSMLNAESENDIGPAFEFLVARGGSTPLVRIPPALEHLPLEEVPVTHGNSDYLAVFLSGDGGWAGLDKEVADGLAARGIPVVGWDSLRYFWSARTPEGVAADTRTVIDHYLGHWRKHKVILIGYSQGANVLPFILNRLPADTQSKVAIAVMMGLEEKAAFEFHLSNWVSESDGLPIAPEIATLPAVDALCLYGADDAESACPLFARDRMRAIKLEGGHHFDGDYDHLAQLILRAAKLAP